jgi:hypothetical protein
MIFMGRKCVTLEKYQCHVSPPYIFSRFLVTFTPIIELWRLESVRRHEVNTLYAKMLDFRGVMTLTSIFGSHFELERHFETKQNLTLNLTKF